LGKTFENYKEVQKIIELNEKTEKIKNKFKLQILQEFKRYKISFIFNIQLKNSSGGLDYIEQEILSDICKIVDVLGEQFRKQVVTQFVQQQIQLYTITFMQANGPGILLNTTINKKR